MKIMSVRFLICVAMLLLSLAACREEEVGAKGRGAMAEVGDTSERGAIVLAKIGDEEITSQDLVAAMERVPARRREAVKDEILDDFVQDRVFAAEARKAGLENDPDVQKAVEKKINETLARYFVKKHLEKEAEPSQEGIKAYYERYTDQFIVPERVLLQHIVVKDRPKAEELLKALKAGGSFEALAKENSVCRCWEKGGVHGWLYKGRVVPELEEEAFGSKKGELRGVIETKQGFEIFKIQDRQDQRKVPFEEAGPRIRKRLFLMKKKQLIDKYYEAVGVNRNPDEQGVLVVIGGDAVSEDVIAPILAKVPEKDRKELRKRWIDYIVEVKVFSDEGRKVHIEDDPEVSRELRSETDRVLANQFRNRLLTDKVKVTDEDVAGYYKSHAEQFRTRGMVRVKSILVETKEEAEEILRQLKEGAVFSSVAMKKSLYPMASRRAGEIGWFSKGEKDPALEKVAFSLEQGQVSDIIKTGAGYEIIKLMDKKSAGLIPLDKVHGRIKMQLIKERQNEVKQDYYKKARVELYVP